MSTRAPAVLLVIWLVAACSTEGPRPSIEQTSNNAWFVDEATVRGLSYSHVSGASPKLYLPELVGGGVALLDVDNDLDLDMYFVQSGAQLTSDTGAQYTNKLFLNDGDGYFVEQDGGDASTNLGYGMGVATGDYNNDGWVDLFITNVGRNVLLRNQRNGTFKDVSLGARLDDEAWGTGAAFADFDNDGDLDLFLVNYVRWSVGVDRDCFSFTLGEPDYCGPGDFQGSQDRVYRNNGDGTFTDVTEAAGLWGVLGNGLGIVTADFDANGLLDVFVANDLSPNHLWLNQGNFEFVEEAIAWGCAFDEHGTLKAGMGIVTDDFDNDLDPDVLVVNLTMQTDTYFRNDGTHFLDVTTLVGLAANTQTYTRFGLGAGDFNNDSWIDFYEANGAITKSVQREAAKDPYAEPNTLYLGTSHGVYDYIGTVSEAFTSRGLALGDVDRDGRVDVVVVDRDQPARLYMNHHSEENNWIKLSVTNVYGAPALGAVVTGRIGTNTVTRIVQSAGSYLAARDPAVLLGLGSALELEDVTVRWLDGTSESFQTLSGNQHWLLAAQRNGRAVQL